MCSEKNSFEAKSSFAYSPSNDNNNMKNQLEKTNLNDSGDDLIQSINIGKNKTINNKDNFNYNQENSNKNIKKENNSSEDLLDTSLELEEGIEKKD